MKLGILDMEMATTHFQVKLDTLAEALQVDPSKYRYGLRQEAFSMPALDEDPVTLAASAAHRLLKRTGRDAIRTMIIATETGVDQSKALGLFVQSLLDLSSHMRIVETKQACYSATAALQMALGLIARNPHERVLVIATDIARYAVDTPGEPTQGAGAVAMLLGANPTLLEIEPISGVWSAHIDDFWRPNDLSTPHVDGARSLDAYLGALTAAWEDYRQQGGFAAAEIDYFVHHQPFTKMAVKGHRRLCEYLGQQIDEQKVEPSLHYTPQLGNSYTASLYMGLLSLLHSQEQLAGKRIGLYSYGSGAAGEFFTVVPQANYRDFLHPEIAAQEISGRQELTFAQYRSLHAAHERGSKENYTNEAVTRAPFRFAGVRDGARYYQANALPAHTGAFSILPNATL